MKHFLAWSWTGLFALLAGCLHTPERTGTDAPAKKYQVKCEGECLELRQRGDVRRYCRLDHRNFLRIKPEADPAFEQGAAHLAGADQNEHAGKITQGIGNRGHASPAVSNMAASMASRADLPAQIAN